MWYLLPGDMCLQDLELDLPWGFRPVRDESQRGARVSVALLLSAADPESSTDVGSGLGAYVGHRLQAIDMGPH